MKDLYETMYETCCYVVFGQSSSFTAFLMVRSSAVMPLYTDKKRTRVNGSDLTLKQTGTRFVNEKQQ